jgi:hypothetical protein
MQLLKGLSRFLDKFDFFDLGPAPGTVMSNTILCVASARIAGQSAISFYYSPNPVSKACFAASCCFGIAGSVSSGVALASTYFWIPPAGVIGCCGAETFHKLGKSTNHLGNVASGNIYQTI